MLGYSEKEIIHMVRDIQKVRSQRQATFAALGTQQKVEEVVETARDKMQKLLFLKKKGQKVKTAY